MVAHRDGPNLAQHAQVPGHVWLRQVELAHEGGDRPLAGSEEVDDLASAGLGDGVESVGGSWGAGHYGIIYQYGYEWRPEWLARLRGKAHLAMNTSQAEESFCGLLLRHRGRTGLTQAQLAERLGIHRRSVQDWEAGVNYPSAERLQALVRVLLEAGGLSAGQEANEAHVFWAAAEREAARMRTPFDAVWFGQLLSSRPRPPGVSGTASTRVPAAAVAIPERRQDWGDAPDVLGLVGRTEELHALRSWALDEGCRLLAVLGVGGIGKTSLTARLAQDVAAGFERVYWRSLRDAPPSSEWLAGAIRFVSDQQLLPPLAEGECITLLLQLLRDRRSLLVLDNFEALFESGQCDGRYRQDVAGYGRVLQAVGESTHQSCLVLTSREEPRELAVLGGDSAHTFRLGGLGVDQAKAVLAPKHLVGADEQWSELVARFAGNGLALKVVGETVRDVFAGDIGGFLEESSASGVFGGIWQRMKLRTVAEILESAAATLPW